MKGSEHPRRRMPALATLATLAVLALAAPASADYAYFTGSWYQNNYVSANSYGCLNNGSCTNHSYTFISAEDYSGSNVICARIWLVGGYSTNWSEDCGADFTRHCLSTYKHSSNPLDCHDQDHTTSFHAGARNSSPGTTIRMHGGY